MPLRSTLASCVMTEATPGAILPSFTSQISAFSSLLSSWISQVAGEWTATPPARAFLTLWAAFSGSCDQQTLLPGWAWFWHGRPYWVVAAHASEVGGDPPAGVGSSWGSE